MVRQPNSKQSRVSSAISRTVAVITTILGLAWLLGAPTSGCIAPKCSGVCVVSNKVGLECAGYDASTCPADGGVCSVRSQCSCKLGLPSCDDSACSKASNDQSETECNAVGTCTWSVVCASSLNCATWNYEQDECKSHSQCTYENQGCG